MKVLVITHEQDYDSKIVKTSRQVHVINTADEDTALKLAVANTLESLHSITDKSLYSLVQEEAASFGRAITFADEQERIISAWIV